MDSRRCPHCGYHPGTIPSDSNAYLQANCEHADSHVLDDFAACLKGRIAQQEKALGFTDEPAPAPLPRSAHSFECPMSHPLGKICTCGAGNPTPQPAPAPALTDGQREAIDVACSLLKGKNGDRAWARRKLRTAFGLAGNTALEGEEAATTNGSALAGIAHAPLPEAVKKALREASEGTIQMGTDTPCAVVLVCHITALSRRVAELEAAYKHVKECLHTSQERAQRAEERVGELEDMKND